MALGGGWLAARMGNDPVEFIETALSGAQSAADPEGQRRHLDARGAGPAPRRARDAAADHAVARDRQAAAERPERA